MIPDLESRPHLALGCRLSRQSGQRLLLMPERALRLNGPSLEIIERCDGTNTVSEIIIDLQKLYSKAQPETVKQDTLEYLGRLGDQRAIDFD